MRNSLSSSSSSGAVVAFAHTVNRWFNIWEKGEQRYPAELLPRLKVNILPYPHSYTSRKVNDLNLASIGVGGSS